MKHVTGRDGIAFNYFKYEPDICYVKNIGRDKMETQNMKYHYLMPL